MAPKRRARKTKTKPIATDGEHSARNEHVGFDEKKCLYTKMDMFPISKHTDVLMFIALYGCNGLGPWFPNEIPSLPDEPEGVVTMRKKKILLETEVIPAWREVTSEEEQRTSWFDTDMELDDTLLEYLQGIFGNRIICPNSNTNPSSRPDGDNLVNEPRSGAGRRVINIYERVTMVDKLD